MRGLKELVAELDTMGTWFSPGSARHRHLASVADELAEHAGGRAEAQPGDPNLATPGPGVRSATTEVDSVGQIAEKPSQTAAEAAAKDPSRLGQNSGEQKQPTG